jgi:ATP-dependent helicase YprA (DUF1998 family)
MCDGLSDLATECAAPGENPNAHHRGHALRLMVYERNTATGVALAGARIIRSLLHATLDAIQRCSCQTNGGCPSCVQSPRCSEFNVVMDKLAAVAILRLLLLPREESRLPPGVGFIFD